MPLPAPIVLAFGDSLVAGYGLPVADGFAAQLERRLHAARPGTRVINAGRSGDTTADAVQRLPALLSRLEQRPDLAIVQLGPNDVLRQLPPARTRTNLEGIIVEFERCGIPVLLTTVDPPPFLSQRAAPYAGLHGEVAGRHGVLIVPFFPPRVLGHQDLTLADGFHPNARAIAMVVEAIAPAVERTLAN